MNREIKFRAWRENKMHYNITTAHYEHNAMSGSGGDLWDFAEWMKWSKVMQYTGLKDKDGKEIYEGDIVTRLANVNYIAPIVFSPTLAAFVLDTSGRHLIDDKYGDYLPLHRQYSYEVIGNIFENSELLK